MGVFWRRASAVSALVTLLAGMALGAAMFVADWTGLYRGDFMLLAFGLLAACLAVMIATSMMFPEPLKDEARPLVWGDWREPLRGEPGGRGLGNYRLAAAAILAVFAALYAVFR